MSTTLSDIKTNVRSKIGRGTALDSSLYGFVVQAVRFIERKMNWTHMYHLNLVTNDLNADHPRTLRANQDIRDIDFIRIIKSDGEDLDPIRTLNKSRSATWAQPDSDFPTQYDLVQENLILFDNTPAAEYTFEIGWWEYANFANADATTHWLFANAQGIVEDIAVIEACRFVRDFQRAGQIWLGTGQKGDHGVSGRLDDMIAAEEDKVHQGAEYVMQRDFSSELMG